MTAHEQARASLDSNLTTEYGPKMQTKKTRTLETEGFYLARYEQIARQTKRWLGGDQSGEPAPNNVVRYLIDRRGSLSKRTWQVYKRSAIFGLETLAATSSDTLLRHEVALAIDKLSMERQTTALTRGTRTSALKARHVSLEDHKRLMSYLRGRFGQDRWAKPTMAWCEASLLTGLRPIEWASAYLESTDKGVPLLVVRNAKASNGRGNGEFRHLDVSAMAPEDLSTIEDMLYLIEWSTNIEQSYSWLQRRVSDCLYRTTRKLFPRRRRHITLYSYRHEFSANAKAFSLQPEVAALMGHGSDATAGRNYARTRRGGRRPAISPIASEVGTVRRVASQGKRRKLGFP